MTKKKVVYILIIAIVIAGYLLLGGNLPSFIKNRMADSSTELTDMEKIKKIITETHKTDVVIMGEDISFSEEIPYRKISSISEEELDKKDEAKYTLFVINDIAGDIQISTEEKDLVSKKINENGFCLIYLGEKYSTTWNDTAEAIATVEGNISFTYYSIDGMPRRSIGTWLKQDQEQLKDYPNSLGDSLMDELGFYLEEMN